MERESLLSLLIILLSGLVLQMFTAWLSIGRAKTLAEHDEHACWMRLWRPIFPALLMATWLCGWALAEPDPVPDQVRMMVFITCVPFGIVFVRALIRAAISLLHRPHGFAIATVGLIHPRIIVASEFMKVLGDRSMQAALEHERAHVRHHDPLRILAGQFAADLQWPWPSAQIRFQRWLSALEHARDDEARANGIDGADLASAILETVRFQCGVPSTAYAQLTGSQLMLSRRIARLLEPPSAAAEHTHLHPGRTTLMFLVIALSVFVLGAAYGERFVSGILALAP